MPVVRSVSAMKGLLLAAVSAALLLGPANAAAQGSAPVGIQNPVASTPTILYFHLVDFQDFPINTQKPDDRYTEETGVGVATPSTTCIPNPDLGGSPFVDHHTYYGYSSPSYVEYDFEQDGKPRTHPERGISYDAQIDAAAPFYLYWYLTTTARNIASAGPADPNMVPVVVPNVIVKATMRAGDAISVDDKAYNTGPIIAQGQTKAATLAADQVIDTAAPGTQHPDVRFVGSPLGGNSYTFEFRVPITVSSPMIPRSTGYNLRIDMYSEVPACPGGQNQPEDAKFMADVVKIHTSPEHRPRMELAIMNPIRLEYLHPQFVGDDLVIHTSMNAAWGNYDVNEQDADGITVSVTGPSPATSLAKAAIVQRTHEHYHHQEAVDITYVWPYKTDRAQNGLYTVQVTFMNDQRTATATGVAQFEIGKGTVIGCGGVQESSERLNDQCGVDVQEDGRTESKDSPGAGFLVLLGVLAAALVVARRRSK